MAGKSWKSCMCGQRGPLPNLDKERKSKTHKRQRDPSRLQHEATHTRDRGALMSGWRGVVGGGRAVGRGRSVFAHIDDD